MTSPYSDVFPAQLEQRTHLQKTRNGYRARECPLCGHSGYAVSLRFDPFQGHCFACDGRTRELREAWGLQRLPSAFQGQSKPRLEANPTPNHAQHHKLERIWNQTTELTPQNAGGRYLAARGLNLERYPLSVRLHEHMAYYEQGVHVGEFPCLVSRVESAGGELRTLQCIYINPDGYGKAPVSAAKKLKTGVYPGAAMGAAISLFSPREQLGIAEGLETALAVHQITGYPTLAAVSAAGMERLELPSGVKEVLIAADHDRNGRGLQAAHTLARRVLEAGIRVRLAIPPLEGQDWLDALLEEDVSGLLEAPVFTTLDLLRLPSTLANTSTHARKGCTGWNTSRTAKWEAMQERTWVEPSSVWDAFDPSKGGW